MSKKITVIIPCAGNNKKRVNFGLKSLIQLSYQECIIEKQIKLIKECYNNPEIIVVTGFQSDKLISIIPKDIKIVENELFEQTSVVRSIGLALRVATNDNVLIVYGDTVFNKFCLPKISNNSLIVVDSKTRMKSDEIGINISNNKAVYFSYGFDVKWANILYIAKKDIEIFKKNVLAKDSRRVFTFEILNKIIDSGCYISCIEPNNMNLIKIDTSKDIEVAKFI